MGTEPHGRVRTQTIEGKTYYNADDLVGALVEDIKRNLPREKQALALACVDAQEALEMARANLGGKYEDFRAAAKAHLEALRATRMSFVQEAAQVVGALRECQELLAGEDARERMERLREFVEISERLRALAKDGTLDAITEASLKLMR
jgi:hypothetical protein